MIANRIRPARWAKVETAAFVPISIHQIIADIHFPFEHFEAVAYLSKRSPVRLDSANVPELHMVGHQKLQSKL